MVDILVGLALLVAVILAIGETVVLVRTDKYWPLSVDDYLACALLVYSALTISNQFSLWLMLLAWSFMAGNLYAMLFTRMDPNGGSRERLPALAALLLFSCFGVALTLVVLSSEVL